MTDKTELLLNFLLMIAGLLSFLVTVVSNFSPIAAFRLVGTSDDGARQYGVIFLTSWLFVWPLKQQRGVFREKVCPRDPEPDWYDWRYISDNSYLRDDAKDAAYQWEHLEKRCDEFNAALAKKSAGTPA